MDKNPVNRDEIVEECSKTLTTAKSRYQQARSVFLNMASGESKEKTYTVAGRQSPSFSSASSSANCSTSTADLLLNSSLSTSNQQRRIPPSLYPKPNHLHLQQSPLHLHSHTTSTHSASCPTTESALNSSDLQSATQASLDCVLVSQKNANYYRRFIRDRRSERENDQQFIDSSGSFELHSKSSVECHCSTYNQTNNFDRNGTIICRTKVGTNNTAVLLPKRRMEQNLSKEDIAAALRLADEYWQRTYGSPPPPMDSELTDSTYSSGSGEEMAHSDNGATITLDSPQTPLSPHTWIEPDCALYNLNSPVFKSHNVRHNSEKEIDDCNNGSSTASPSSPADNVESTSSVNSNRNSSSTTEDSYEPESDYVKLDPSLVARSLHNAIPLEPQSTTCQE